MRPSRDADHLRMIRLADDDHRASILAVRLYKLVNMRHMGACRVDHWNASRIALRIDFGRHAVAADDDRFAGRDLVERIHTADARLPEPLDLLRIVDKRSQRNAGELFFSTFKRFKHRAPHAEAKSGMLSNREFHTHLPVPVFIPKTHFSILPIFINSLYFSIFLPVEYKFLNFALKICV